MGYRRVVPGLPLDCLETASFVMARRVGCQSYSLALLADDEQFTSVGYMEDLAVGVPTAEPAPRSRGQIDACEDPVIEAVQIAVTDNRIVEITPQCLRSPQRLDCSVCAGVGDPYQFGTIEVGVDEDTVIADDLGL